MKHWKKWAKMSMRQKNSIRREHLPFIMQRIHHETSLEQGRFSERLREILTLAIFTVGAAVTSVVTMDIIVYPLTIFAVEKTEVFTELTRWSILVLALLYILFRILRRIYILATSGLTPLEFVRYLLGRPWSYVSLFLTILITTLLVTGIIAIILRYNSHLLYRLYSG